MVRNLILGLLISFFAALVGRAEVQDLAQASPVAGPKMYFQQSFGLLYNNPSWTADSRDVLSCNDRLETFSYSTAKFPEGWVKVKIRGKDGFVPLAFLAERRAVCFAEKYPKFFDRFNLSTTERFYWGRLYGRYLWGDTTSP